MAKTTASKTTKTTFGERIKRAAKSEPAQLARVAGRAFGFSVIAALLIHGMNRAGESIVDLVV